MMRTSLLAFLIFSYTLVLGQLPIGLSTANLFSALREHINISPGGVVFLKSTVKRGILPQMLEEILNTRIMVKQSMKKHAKVKQSMKKQAKVKQSIKRKA
jgi:hypothetical protein